MDATPGSIPDFGSGNGEDYANALRPGARFDEYVLTGVIGEGGFGIVYSANDTRLRRPAAIKEYMPAALARRTGNGQVVARSARLQETFAAGLERFVEEAQQIAAFEHNAIVRVYRSWELNGTAYMAMKYYDGPTMRQALRQRRTPVDQAWLMPVLDWLTDALETLHAGQCLHRDVAPDNVIMSADDRPVLLDFGAARQVIGGMTQALTAVLKPGYAPIEQYGEIRGMKQGPWTDVYALAAVVYYSIVGEPPPQAVERMVTDPLVPLSARAPAGFDAWFLAAIDRALAFQPERRTQSIAQLREEIGLPPIARAASNARGRTQHASTTHSADEQPTVRVDTVTSERTVDLDATIVVEPKRSSGPRIERAPVAEDTRQGGSGLTELLQPRGEAKPADDPRTFRIGLDTNADTKRVVPPPPNPKPSPVPRIAALGVKLQ